MQLSRRSFLGVVHSTVLCQSPEDILYGSVVLEVERGNNNERESVCPDVTVTYLRARCSRRRREQQTSPPPPKGRMRYLVSRIRDCAHDTHPCRSRIVCRCSHIAHLLHIIAFSAPRHRGLPLPDAERLSGGAPLGRTAAARTTAAAAATTTRRQQAWPPSKSRLRRLRHRLRHSGGHHSGAFDQRRGFSVQQFGVSVYTNAMVAANEIKKYASCSRISNITSTCPSSFSSSSPPLLSAAAEATDSSSSSSSSVRRWRLLLASALIVCLSLALLRLTPPLHRKAS